MTINSLQRLPVTRLACYRTQGKGQTKLSFKITSQNHDDLRLHTEEALVIKRLKPELNKRQQEMGTGFLP